MSWKTYSDGTQILETSLSELAETFDGQWVEPFDVARYREARLQGVGEPAYDKTQRSSHWKLSGSTKAISEQSKRMTDSLGRKGIVQVLLIGLTERDVRNLESLAEGHRLKNLGAIARDVFSKAARA